MAKKYMRKCPECNELVFHSSASSRSHCRNSKCRKCSDKNKSRSRNGVLNGKWKGYEGVSRSYFNDVRNRSLKRKHEFSITISDIWWQFEKQNQECIFTGLKLELPRRTRSEYHGNASLDRIDSSKGYILNNVQWVHKDINWMKQDFEDDYFVQMCNFVANNTSNKVETPIDIFIKNNRSTDKIYDI